MELLTAADEFGIESLYEYTMKHFIENYEDYIKKNPVKILQLIYDNENLNELKNIYLEKFLNIVKNYLNQVNLNHWKNQFYWKFSKEMFFPLMK